MDALAALDGAGARTVPWEQAKLDAYDLILLASPKGEISLLHGTRVLLPHGAGFGKTVSAEGSADSASGLDPVFLMPGGQSVADVHALAHPGQVARLTSVNPEAAARTTVVGDPTLDRLLESAPMRKEYRTALRTGDRRLVVLASSWGAESLLARRPGLPAWLAARLPHDGYQLALILHPNEHSRLGGFDLRENLAPALRAGMVLAEPYEGWASLLVAADLVVTDHGSAALYGAALGRAIANAYDGGEELLPGTPIAELLSVSPRLGYPPVDGDEPLGSVVETLIAAHRPDAVRRAADAAFAYHGRSLERLREELYALLGLSVPPAAAEPRLLPVPASPAASPAAFAVRVTEGADSSRGPILLVERLPAGTDLPAHHLAAEHGRAGARHLQSAAVHYRHSHLGPAVGGVRTAAAWIDQVFAAYPGCRTAAVILGPAGCLFRRRDGVLTVLAAVGAGGADPAAFLSAVHAAHTSRTIAELPAAFTCEVGRTTTRITLRPATQDEARTAV